MFFSSSVVIMDIFVAGKTVPNPMVVGHEII